MRWLNIGILEKLPSFLAALWLAPSECRSEEPPGDVGAGNLWRRLVLDGLFGEEEKHGRQSVPAIPLLTSPLTGIAAGLSGLYGALRQFSR